MSQVESKEAVSPSAEQLASSLARAVASRPRIAAAYLYGSAAAGRMTPLSDVDVAVLFGPAVEPAARRLLGSQVAAELAGASGGHRVEVRDLEELPLVIQGRVLTEGVGAGTNDPVRRVRFETETRMMYFDFLPFHRLDVAEGLKGLRRKLSGG